MVLINPGLDISQHPQINDNIYSMFPFNGQTPPIKEITLKYLDVYLF
jgi:hypothetical protein